ncbi:hypothetical protein MCEL_01050 [Mycolicibacterium celeriflavum]|uniref:Uncharacterized protein n=1 Tax=Mycolicibacterium celeriflavum TaxID=1249101 RepID=A0A7I7RBQ4_MYCCF|nr:hypothetical protein MCEL_01050 [Mycolicibacterium celeriflavum]
MARLREERSGWDWWREMDYPPGPLREFNPDDWPAATEREAYSQFWDARRAAAPRGWVIARLRMRRHRRRAKYRAT